MGVVDQAIADLILEHGIDLLRLEAGVRAQVLRLLEDLRRELTAQLASEDLTAFGKQRTQQLLRQASATIDNYFAKMQGELDLTLQGVGRIQAQHIADILTLHVNIGASLPTETFLLRLVSNILIQGAPSSEWWSRQNQDTAFRFANAVRQGVAAGETTDQIVRRITGGRGGVGVMDISARNATALVRTSIQTVANAARRETFQKNADIINGIQQLSTLDGRTTEICIAYSGAEWDLNYEPINGTTLPYNNGVPRHWNCRSVETAITKTFAELGLNLPEPAAGTRASEGGPVPVGTTFEQWLERRTVAQQDEQLGPGRAQLWRDGKITLNQLLDLSGNPMSLRELHAKYGE